MLSRRLVLGGLGATVCSRSLAAAGPLASVSATPVALAATAATDLRLASSHPALDAVRLAGNTGGRLAAGEAAALELHNALPEAVQVRWDGLRGWGALDAPAAEQIPRLDPGATRTVSLTPRDPGTTLVRAAPSAAHLAARGLQAVLVVDGAEPPADRDIPLLFADRLFTADGAPRFGTVPPADAAVAVVTVNGRPAPWDGEAPPRARLRLRLVNGSVRRLMLVGCEGAHPVVVAIDGQPSEMFAPARNTVPIGPGARYDLLVDMPEVVGTEVRLVLKPTERLGTALEPERTLVRLRTAGDPVSARPLIAPLPPNPALPTAIALEAARRADLVIAGTPGTPTAAPRNWTVNGVAGAATVLRVRRGETVTLGLINTTTTLVPLRIAGHAVRILHARDDGWDPYWRDTILLVPAGRTHIAFVADVPGRWAIDSGFDDLTLAGLSCAFEVAPH